MSDSTFYWQYNDDSADGDKEMTQELPTTNTECELPEEQDIFFPPVPDEADFKVPEKKTTRKTRSRKSRKEHSNEATRHQKTRACKTRASKNYDVDFSDDAEVN